MLDDMPVLFTNSRIVRDSIPEGVFCYDVRHDDECQGIASEVKSHVFVNHWGTILSKQEVPLEDGSYYPKEDLNYLGWVMNLGEFQMLSNEEFSNAAKYQMNGMQQKM